MVALSAAEEACRLDPWFFIKNFMFTMDEHDLKNPIKRFPAHLYAEKITRAWHKHNKLGIVKARQIMLSWLMVGLYFWLAFFHKGALVFFVSKKEEDADSLLDRARIIYDNLPEPWKIGNPVSQKYCHLEFPDQHSRIRALPSGTNQIRMHTSSGILLDEAAFQDNQRDNCTSAFPSVRRGGKLTLVSTPNGPNYFSEIINDTSTGSGVDDGYEKDTWVGLKTYDSRMNPNNGFFVIDVGIEELIKGECIQKRLTGKAAVKYHREFIEQAKEGLDEQGWQQEYCRNFYVVKGKKVYPRYSDAGMSRNLLYNEYRPLLCSWDFGYHWPAVLFAQYNDEDRILYVLGEFMGHDIEIFDFIPQVKEYIEEHWPNIVEFEHFCDPAGSQVNDKSMKSSIDVLCDNSIFPAYCRSSINEGIDIVRDLMKDKGFYIDKNCRILRRGLIGGIVYQETKEGTPESELPKKDGFYEHLHDCLRYMMVNKLTLFKTPPPKKKEESFKIPLFHQSEDTNQGKDHWAYGH